MINVIDFAAVNEKCFVPLLDKEAIRIADIEHMYLKRIVAHLMTSAEQAAQKHNQYGTDDSFVYTVQFDRFSPADNGIKQTPQRELWGLRSARKNYISAKYLMVRTIWLV